MCRLCCSLQSSNTLRLPSHFRISTIKDQFCDALCCCNVCLQSRVQHRHQPRALVGCRNGSGGEAALCKFVLVCMLTDAARTLLHRVRAVGFACGAGHAKQRARGGPMADCNPHEPGLQSLFLRNGFRWASDSKTETMAGASTPSRERGLDNFPKSGFQLFLGVPTTNPPLPSTSTSQSYAFLLPFPCC